MARRGAKASPRAQGLGKGAVSAYSGTKPWRIPMLDATTKLPLKDPALFRQAN